MSGAHDLGAARNEPMSQPQHVTRDDLRDFVADLKSDFRDGLGHIADRLDGLTTQVKETNGRVRTLESGAAVANQRITSLEKETFRRWGDPPQVAARAEAEGGVVIPKKWIAAGLSIGAGVGAALVALIQAFLK